MKEILLDPSDLDKFVYREIDSESIKLKTLNREYFNKLDDVSKDVIELYYYKGVKQKTIASLFGVTQGNISSLLKSIRTYLAWVDKIPEKPPCFEEECYEALEASFKGYGSNPRSVDLKLRCVLAYLKTLHQSQAAYETGTTQYIIRASLMDCLEGLYKLKYLKSYDYLNYLKDKRLVNSFKHKMDCSERPVNYCLSAKEVSWN